MRGSLSALTSALITFMILTSLLTYTALELRRVPTQLARLNYELVSQVSNSAKDVEVVLNDEGLYLRSANPPFKLLSLLSIGNSGVNNLLSNLTISRTYEKILAKEAVDAILLSNSYLLIILEGGRYFIINNKFVGNPVLAGALSSGEFVKLQNLNLSNYLGAFLYVGILKDLNSYMSNPIPGLPSDSEANYIPVGYVLLTNNSHTISKGDWFIYTDPRSTPYRIGHVYGSGQTAINYLGMGYYRVDSNHSVFVKWYESVSGYTSGWYISYETLMTGIAGLWAYPIVIGNKTIDLVFEIKNLGNPTTIHLRPVIYIVMPEDYVRGFPIIPHQTNPTLEAPIRYSAVRPLYSWEGNLSVRTLGTNSTTTIPITLDSGTILKLLNVSVALTLVGFRFASTNPLSIKLTSHILDYDVSVDVGDDEVGKYVFLPASINVVPEITSPNGSEVAVYRPTNFLSSLIDYPALFIPQVGGTYIIRYKLSTYTSLPQLNLQVGLGGNYEPVVEYLRNQHLGGWSKVVNDLIVLEPNHAVLRDYEYFTAGSETWYSGDLIKVNGLPVNTELNFTYYITTTLQGTTALSTGQNRSVDYVYCWSSWSCYNYWRVHFTSYPSNLTTKLYVSGEVLYPTGSYYLRFRVTVKLSDITLTAIPYVVGIKHLYRSGTTAYTTFLSTQFAELVRIDNKVLLFT